MQTEQRTALYDAAETKAADTRNFEFAFAQRQRRQGLMLQVPIGLVVSLDQEVRRQRREKLSPTTALDKPSRVPLPRYAPRSGYHHKIHPGQSNPGFRRARRRFEPVGSNRVFSPCELAYRHSMRVSLIF